MIEPWLFIFGLCFGSFLNAAVYRLRHRIGIVKERSICPNCRHILAFLDLIPLFSFLSLRGKCRYCAKSISWHYPIVELMAGIIFVLGARFVAAPAELFYYLLVSVILLFIAVYDFFYLEIPDLVSLPAIIIILAWQFLRPTDWLAVVLAGFIIFAFFAIQFIISKGTWIGGGDLRLGFLMGIFLGQWQLAVLALTLAYITGAVVGLILIAGQKSSWQSKLPFGPFLVLATWVSFLFGSQIIYWYSHLFV